MAGTSGGKLTSEAERASLPRPASAPELKDVIEAERRGVPFLIYRDGDGVQRLHPLEDERAALTIGRGSEVDLSLSWDPNVSSVHAEAVRLGAHWLIGDEGISRNGTFVNSERLSGRRRLRDGDVVRVGRTAIAFNDASGEQDAATTMFDEETETPTVTEAQRRVLGALCRPYRDRSRFATPATNLEIAAELFLGVESVKTHLRELYRRFGLEELPQNQKRARLAERAIELGLAEQRER